MKDDRACDRRDLHLRRSRDVNKKIATCDETTRSIVVGIIHLGITIKSLITLSECHKFRWWGGTACCMLHAVEFTFRVFATKAHTPLTADHVDRFSVS